ncbi:hypothetical protein ACFOYU_19460 [Microvirga sp. GCM10011540]|uniref:hypothetical protein n=1 Tax=Microvirga sp. GCM10011540 TaxID=3317338 RepID=UPI00361D1A03
MPWEYDDPWSDPLGLANLDPYLRWSLGPGREDFLLPRTVGQRIPLLVRWRENKNEAKIRDLWRRLTGEAEWAGRSPPGSERFETHFLTFREVRRLFAEREFRPFTREAERATPGPPLPDASVTARNAPFRPRPTSTSGPLTSGTVIVGIIDDGLAFGHERFQRADGTTRIESVWIQDGEDDGRSGYGYGCMITKAEIDALLADAAQRNWDEDEFYRRAGVADFAREGRRPVARRASHGAHVMDLACGFAPGEAPDWRIVGVQLPTATTADSSGASLAPYVVDAVKHIRDAALAMAGGEPAPPVAINFSYGLTAGPHDGTHEIETAIDEIVRDHNAVARNRPMRVVIPSGNSHLARLHARVSFDTPDEAVELPWRVQPDDLTPSFVEIWLPPGPAGADRIALTLVTPSGEDSTPLQVKEGQLPALRYVADGTVLCEARYHRAPAPTDRGMLFVALKPTVRPGGAAGPRLAAESGIWRLRLKNRGLQPGEMVEAWVQRDDAPIGYPTRGRQSYFDHACYRRYDHGGRPIEEDDISCIVRRYGSINAIATGCETIIVGGVYRKELRPVPYSAGGPVTVPVGATQVHRDGPDALTVSDDSVAHPGVLGAGTRSGSVVVMNGTSVAAPRITRWIACELAAGRPGDRDAVEQLATDHEAQLDPPKPPPERGGAGRIVLPPVRMPRGIQEG